MFHVTLAFCHEVFLFDRILYLIHETSGRAGRLHGSSMSQEAKWCSASGAHGYFRFMATPRCRGRGQKRSKPRPYWCSNRALQEARWARSRDRQASMGQRQRMIIIVAMSRCQSSLGAAYITLKAVAKSGVNASMRQSGFCHRGIFECADKSDRRYLG